MRFRCIFNWSMANWGRCHYFHTLGGPLDRKGLHTMVPRQMGAVHCWGSRCCTTTSSKWKDERTCHDRTRNIEQTRYLEFHDPTISRGYYLIEYIPLFWDRPGVYKDAGFQRYFDRSCQRHCNLVLYALSLHISPAFNQRKNNNKGS